MVRPLTIAGAIGVGIAATLLARATMLPDVGLWDTAEAQTIPPILGTMHPTGFPAYVLLGWLASVALGPLGSPAFVMNVFSAICLGIAAGSTVVLVGLLTDRLAVAIAAATGLVLTPIAWGLGVRADVHALHLALVAIGLALLVGWGRAREAADGAGAVRPGSDRWLIAAAVAFGLALANHRLVILLGPGIAAYVLAVEPDIVRRGRLVATCLAASLGTAAVLYLELPIRAGLSPAPLVYGHPETLVGFLDVVLGAQFAGAASDLVSDPGAAMGKAADILTGQFGPLLLLVPVGLLATIMRRPRYAILTTPGVVLTVIFAIVYDNALIERYWAVPLLIGWTWLAVGAVAAVDAIVRHPDGRTRALGTVAAALALLLPTIMDLGPRWRGVDASGDVEGRRWLEAALAAIEDDAVVVSWWSYSTPLWYAQHIEGRRHDVWVVDDRTRLDEDLGDITDVIDANLGLRPVYAIRVDERDIACLIGRYRVTTVAVPAGQSLLRIDGRREGA